MARYLKKKEKKSGALFWVLGILIVAIIIVILMFANRFQSLHTGTNVETPYCTLHYPEKWASQVRIETSESPMYCVSYYAVFSGKAAVKLFDISFGEETANPTGMIRMENGEMVTVCVSPCTPEPDKNRTEDEWNIVHEMLDDLNYILERIPFSSAPEETEPTQMPTTEAVGYQDVRIDTPYGQLAYPGKWQDYLQVTHTQGSAYVVSFAALMDEKEAQPLFDIVFSDSSELGVLSVDGSTIGVSLRMHPFAPDGSWQASQIEMVFSMQEDINYIIERLDLTEAPATDIPEETEPPQAILDATDPEEAVPATTQPAETTLAELVIETPYGHLKYPGKWRSLVTTEVTDTDVYIVAFYGTVGTHDRVHLFSVCFGDAAETAIGIVRDAVGNEVTFSIIPSEFVSGGGWSAEESDRIYEMMEDANYLISALLAE